MAYTPPTGNAVNFDFTDTPYSPPSAHSILFNFGAVPGPPFLTAQLPTGLRQHLLAEDEWFPDFRRKFAPLTTTVVPKPMQALFRLDDDVQEWVMPRLRIGYVPIAVTTRRPVLFTIT